MQAEAHESWLRWARQAAGGAAGARALRRSSAKFGGRKVGRAGQGGVGRGLPGPSCCVSAFQRVRQIAQCEKNKCVWVGGCWCGCVLCAVKQASELQAL